MKLSSSVLTAFFVLAFQTGCGKLPPHTGAKEVPFEWPDDAGYKLTIDRKGIRPANSDETAQANTTQANTTQASTTQQTEAEQIIAQQKSDQTADNLSNPESTNTRLNVPAAASSSDVTAQQSAEYEDFEQYLAFKKWQESNPGLATNEAEDFKRWKEWQLFKKIEPTTEY